MRMWQCSSLAVFLYDADALTLKLVDDDSR